MIGWGQIGYGAVLSAVAAGPLGARFGQRALLVAAFTAVGPAAVLYALAPTFPAALAALLVLGFVYLGVLSGVSVVCQLRAPRRLRARVASLFMLVLGGGYPLGLVVHGWLGDRVGLRPVTVTGGLGLLAVVVAVRLVAPRQIAALSPPVEEAAADEAA
jgi:MFS family permease